MQTINTTVFDVKRTDAALQSPKSRGCTGRVDSNTRSEPSTISVVRQWSECTTKDSDDCLNTLCESNDVFKSAPKLFIQLYVLHGSLGETTVPLVYAYLERKDTAVYTELLTALTNQCTARNLTFAPQFIHIDFEDAVIKSIHAVIGLVPEIQCCFFHLCQNTWKHIQNLGLVDTYKNDPAFSLFCCMLDGIAFLPVADIVPGMAYCGLFTMKR